MPIRNWDAAGFEEFFDPVSIDLSVWREHFDDATRAA
jgi:hypothetical protein